MERIEFDNNFYRYYELLENNMIETFRYVEPNEKNMKVYSLEYTRLVQDICSEVENILKYIVRDDEEYIKKENSKVKPNFYDLVKYVEKYESNITNYEVKGIKYLNLIIKPFETYTKRTWWVDHNGVKHNRYLSFELANLKNAYYALAGLYLLLDILASREINIDKDTDYLNSKLFESNVPKKRATMKLRGLTLEVIDDK